MDRKLKNLLLKTALSDTIKGMRRARRIKIWISVIFRTLLVLAGAVAILEQNWMSLAMLFITLFLTFLPSIIEKEFKFDLPSEFEVAILILICGSLYLGEIHAFYYKIWWWDIFLHGFSGITIGAIGFTLIYILNRHTNVAMSLSHTFVAIFAFCFAMSIGALWEIFEYIMDVTFGLNMQKSGLNDTMGDLMITAVCGFFVSVVGYFYMEKDMRPFLRLERKLLRPQTVEVVENQER
jgi:hypothetical protein